MRGDRDGATRGIKSRGELEGKDSMRGLQRVEGDPWRGYARYTRWYLAHGRSLDRRNRKRGERGVGDVRCSEAARGTRLATVAIRGSVRVVGTGNGVG